MKLYALSLLALSTLSFGAEEPSTKVLGSFETRPTYDSLSGVFRTENSAEAGVQLSPKVSISYLQAVNTNIYNPQTPDSQGLNAALDVGFIRTRVKDIWTDGDSLSLSYQNRAYIPVNESAQNFQNLLVLRNYFTLSKKVSDVVKLSVSEIPILFVNGRSGYENAANTVFENRVYLQADVQITEKLAFAFPLMFHQTRKANHSETAANNNSWTHFAWIYPELSYAIDNNYSLGLAYYNNSNLIKSDFSGFQIGKALEDGAYQFVFSASL